jgi:hypothetical protein
MELFINITFFVVGEIIALTFSYHFLKTMIKKMCYSLEEYISNYLDYMFDTEIKYKIKQSQYFDNKIEKKYVETFSDDIEDL